MVEKEIKQSEDMQIVIFKIGEEEFGVNISEVREIIKMEQITDVPNSAEYVNGVINLRGGIIVVVDLGKKLELPSEDSEKEKRIVVMEKNGNTVGMIVDFCNEVMDLKGPQIKPAPKVITKKIKSDYITGVGVVSERLIILLDLEKVLLDSDMDDIKSIEDSMINK